MIGHEYQMHPLPLLDAELPTLADDPQSLATAYHIVIVPSGAKTLYGSAQSML
jgi:hypothetical protein